MELKFFHRFFASFVYPAAPEDGTGEPLQNAPFWPISASDSNFNPRNIKYIPVVEILAFPSGA